MVVSNGAAQDIENGGTIFFIIILINLLDSIMNWILMNVVTDALRKFSVECGDGRGKNVDGNCFTVEIKKAERRKEFIEHCNHIIPSLDIKYDAVSKLSHIDDIFKFRLMQKNERIDLLKIYVDKLPWQIHDLLVSRPVYTFVNRSPNEIVDAFVKVGMESQLNTLEDVIRVVSTETDNSPGQKQPLLDEMGKLISFLNSTLSSYLQ
ncbi:U14-like protein [Lissonota sp. PSUC_FEM 10030012]|nr:U14-like protein [Lissonota sp. PSUC_FEM 10030012]